MTTFGIYISIKIIFVVSYSLPLLLPRYILVVKYCTFHIYLNAQFSSRFKVCIEPDKRIYTDIYKAIAAMCANDII